VIRTLAPYPDSENKNSQTLGTEKRRFLSVVKRLGRFIFVDAPSIIYSTAGSPKALAKSQLLYVTGRDRVNTCQPVLSNLLSLFVNFISVFC
jgi:hypothetical protein